MNSSNKLAIIIPLFKRDFFEETLGALYNQTDKRFNLYIGNDASPANFDDILEKSSIYLIEKTKSNFLKKQHTILIK